ncbi:GyrI-like domain-containing protein [Aquabacterium sp. OR-4]|uniref:GyrI-like domain-containing protein n=1 Tax=Aquabacterium sp. OR-4 TaxID=2978127 RepID=UPI0021B3009B|nr:GyrI-like domain-containing protein [Aquabacterium sp. OR-4]MDT7837199.1 GyrI-like domain-containing protein [Aquabacterium sp. OR-4]
MHLEHQAQAIRIIGLELRTSNAQAAQSIPPHWARAMQPDALAPIAGRLGSELYAVYTHFEHAGRSNAGLYSLIIGVPVAADAPQPPGFSHAVLPACWRAVFNSPPGQPERVVETWAEVWRRDDLPKAFVADAERYGSDGSIALLIGLTHAP